MDESLYRAILAIIAIGGVFGNIIAFLVARAELQGQRKETEKLAHLTSELEHKVQKLNVELDQRIQRLYRVRDLLGRYLELMIQHRNRKDNLNDPDVLLIGAQGLTCFVELMGLVNVIGDKELLSLTHSMNESSTVLQGDDVLFAAEDPADRFIQLNDAYITFNQAVRDAFGRIYRLIEEQTKDLNK